MVCTLSDTASERVESPEPQEEQSPVGQEEQTPVAEAASDLSS